MTRLAVKSGYPPKTLTIVPELPLASLGLKAGDQIIVGQKAGVSQPSLPPRAAPAPGSQNSPANTGRQAQTTTSARTASAVASNPIIPTPQSNSTEPDAVRAEGGFLIHRVSARPS